MSFGIGRDEKMQFRKRQKTIDYERGGDTPEKHPVAGIFDEIPVGILRKIVLYAGVKGVGKIKSVCKTSWDRFGGDSNSYS